MTGRPRIWSEAQLDLAADLAWQGVSWPEIHRRVTQGQRRGTECGLYRAAHAYRYMPPLSGRAGANDRADDRLARCLDRPSGRQRMLLRCEPETARRLMGWP